MNDKERLLSAMNNLGGGTFEQIDISEYEDQELATHFNEMLKSINERDNHFLMRINDVMSRIADSSWLKALFDTIEEQSGVLEELTETKDIYSNLTDQLDDGGMAAFTLARQIIANYHPCLDNVDSSLKLIRDRDENGCISERSADALERQMEFLYNSIRMQLDNFTQITDLLYSCHNHIGKIVETTDPLLANVSLLAESCRRLQLECFTAGQNMYMISRCVDNARNDMFRQNSAPTIHDDLKVYAVDHITLVWRLYNHMAEYETLRITQVNNPTTCKFGVWCEKTAPDWIRKNKAYKNAMSAHEKLHFHAIACFNAKESFNKELALEEFGKALEALEGFLEALEDLHVAFRLKGVNEETPVWQFNG